MKNRTLIPFMLGLIFVGSSCEKKERISDYQSEILETEAISEHIFLHRSFLETKTWGKVGCNGMIFIKNGEAIIFDAPTNDVASEELLSWLGTAVKVKGVVANHFHDDCLGGLKAFHDNGIPSYAHKMTIEFAQNDSLIGVDYIPQNTFEDVLELTVGGETIINQYFGRGHTYDNIISYVSSEKALFGGCLVKSIGAGKGNLADADTTQWSVTVEKIIEAFPDVALVVPGHGEIEDSKLLHFTAQLFKIPTDDSGN